MTGPGGPWFEDLVPGWEHRSPATLVDSGVAAVHLALSGDHPRTATEPGFARTTGLPGSDAVPGVAINSALLAHVAIAQSTPATREVVANLCYRDVLFPRVVPLGAALATTTRVVAAAWAAPRPDRPPRGKVLLELTTVADDGQPVATLRRLALVRAKGARPDGDGGAEIDSRAHRDVAGTAAALGLGEAVPVAELPGDLAAIDWRVDSLCEPVADPVALVRLTNNLARAHRDPRRGQHGRPLVYGGHTISLAQAALARIFTPATTVVAWRECDHPAPVFADDLVLTSARVVAALRTGTGVLAELEVVTDRVADDPGAAGRSSEGAAVGPGSDVSAVRVQNWRPHVFWPQR